MAKAIGMLPDTPVIHPLWLALTQMLAALPFGGVIERLNFSSVVYGSLSVAILFRITKRLIFELIRESPAVQFIPEDDSNGGQTVGTHFKKFCQAEVREYLLSVVGASIVACCFAFCTPFWIAASALSFQAFDTLLVLVVIDRFFSYYFSGNSKSCIITVFLCGVGVIESPLFIVITPLILLFVLRRSIIFEQISESFIILLMVTFMVGVNLNLGILTFLSLSGKILTGGLLLQIFKEQGHSHFNALARGLPPSGWLLIVLQTVFPVLIVYQSLKIFSLYQSELRKWKWGIINLIITFTTLYYLLNMPESAWWMARSGSHLPVIPYLSTSFVAGMLFTYWMLLAFMQRANEKNEQEGVGIYLRVLGCTLGGLIFFTSAQTIHRNFSDSDSRQSKFIDQMADEILREANPAKCLLSDSFVAPSLAIKAYVGKHPITLLAATRAHLTTPPAGERDLPFHLIQPLEVAAQKKSSEAFLKQWLQKNPQACQQVAVISHPEIFQLSGFTPIPSGLIYSANAPSQPLMPQALARAHYQRSLRVLSILNASNPTRPLLLQIQSNLKAHLSRVTNDLGVLLENLESPQEAAKAYAQALEINPENLSALLNAYGLSLKSDATFKSVSGSNILSRIALDPNFFTTFDTKILSSGMLKRQRADEIMPLAMQQYPTDEPHSLHITRLFGSWLQRCAPLAVYTPSGGVIDPPAPRKEVDTQLVQALAALEDGKTTQAESLLRLYVRSRPQNLSAWSVLAEILMNRNQFDEVENDILPQMKAIKSEDQTLVNMTEGALLTRCPEPDYQRARDCFLRVLDANPRLLTACAELLNVDQRLGNATYIEADALKIVENFPDHPQANAILGSLELSRNQLRRAEVYLLQSIHSQPAAGSCNDLAELYLRQKDYQSAETYARQSIRLSIGFYQAWDTLGNILLGQNRLEEAGGAVRCALFFGPNDVRLYLTLARLYVQQGRLPEAERLLQQIKPLAAQNTPSVLQDFNAVYDQLLRINSAARDSDTGVKL
ncbi:MAG: tetratricopeptide repeat protein [Kiritimatiellae bacterium]|nr:tetratricopeptide repeat protein [Kiritimatiellia bacterium]